MKKFFARSLTAIFIAILALSLFPFVLNQGIASAYETNDETNEETTCSNDENRWNLTAINSLKGYPDLTEYIWQKNATMLPNGPYDKIGLHRLVNTNIATKSVIFLAGCPMWGAATQRITNPPNDNFTKTEDSSDAIYWANRGFDVYSIDYRTHFIPSTLNATQRAFTLDWTWDVWISDIKEATTQLKAVSDVSKFFMAGECSGGEAALNYATKYGCDLKGIILLEPNWPPIVGYPVVGTIDETNTFNLTAAVAAVKQAGNYTNDPFASMRPFANYAFNNPEAPAEYPLGTPLQPILNPLTNETWANITEWFAYRVYSNFNSSARPLGMYSNTLGGYGDITNDLYIFANSEGLPTRLFIETEAMADWVNCPYVPFDYNDHYKDIDVPIIAFVSGLYANRTGAFMFENGTANSDLTGIYLPEYGHIDAFVGSNVADDIFEPAYHWMLNHSTTHPNPPHHEIAPNHQFWRHHHFFRGFNGLSGYWYRC